MCSYNEYGQRRFETRIILRRFQIIIMIIKIECFYGRGGNHYSAPTGIRGI